LLPLLWALPRQARIEVGRFWLGAGILRRLWHELTRPALGWIFYAATLWVWHLPRLYQLTLRNEALHEAMHISFLVGGLLFWWPLWQPLGRRRLDQGTGILYLFTTMLHGMALAALITLSPSPLYPAYADTVSLWGLTLLEDQQLAGLFMWIPVNFVYLIALGGILFSLMREIDQRTGSKRAAR
jgi:putative membrane protein